MPDAALVSKQNRQAPGFYRGMLGAFEVTALSDGNALRHMDRILNKPDITIAEYAADHEAQPVNLSINAYLINTGSHLVLIDTGAGELLGDTSGLLISNLHAAGYRTDQIDAILLTHIHADHSGGLSVGGVRQFPNATVHVDGRDLEYFVTERDHPGQSSVLRTTVQQSRATVGPYLDVKKIALIKEGEAILPGITARSQPGHTPGHMATTSEQMPAYEVATIKPWDGKGFGMPLRLYIQEAFGISPNVTGSLIGPDWINSTRYVIQGKPPDSVREAMQAMTNEERKKETDLMEQSLLANRFQLKAHFETREMPVYQLVLAKGGPKLKVDPDLTKRQFAMGGSMIRARAMPTRGLSDVLECAADVGGREVIDKTGLTGTYDFSLKWAAMEATGAPGGESGTAPSPDVEGASLFTAIEEQLGLKLVPAKGSVQVLVIDHIEQPSEN
jgi:uncharacterized protein (TIGR03435 family)